MNFDITDEQRRTQQAARDFAERVLAPLAADVDRLGRLERETIAQLGEAGWLGMTIPGEHGGSDVDFVGLVLALEELAAVCANTAAFVATNVLVTRALLKYGSEAQLDSLLPALARGQTTAAPAMIDPDELVNAQRHDDGSYKLYGKLSGMTLFGQPDHVFTFGYDSAAGVVKAFVIPYVVGENLQATVLPASLGKRAAGLATLALDGVRVSGSAVRGESGASCAIAMLDDARILAAAEALGIARAAYDRAILHVKALPKSTDPGLLGVQVLVADMCVELEAARLLTLRAARHADADVGSSSERSMAKLFASEMANRVVQKAMQIQGASEVLSTPSVERNFRDARMTELSEDSLATQRAVIAQAMLRS